MTTRIVTLTTDFGLNDSYVAEMKAAILGICPVAVIVDVTHGVERFSVHAGAFMLASAAPYFPGNSVHVGVVDPGVGTQRRPIIVESERGCFVGPDNGLLILAAEAQGIKRVYEIATRRLMLPHVSSTFHGRDVFAPAAAHILNGVALEEFGPQITNFVRPSFTKVSRDKNSLSGEILHTDNFGNIITNVHVRDITGFAGSLIQVQLPHGTFDTKIRNTYGDAKPEEAIALVGSHNFLEVAVNQGNAAERFHAKTGDKITLSVV